MPDKRTLHREVAESLVCPSGESRAMLPIWQSIDPLRLRSRAAHPETLTRRVYLFSHQVDERQPGWNPLPKPAGDVILDSVIRLRDYHHTD